MYIYTWKNLNKKLFTPFKPFLRKLRVKLRSAEFHTVIVLIEKECRKLIFSLNYASKIHYINKNKYLYPIIRVKHTHQHVHTQKYTIKNMTWKIPNLSTEFFYRYKLWDLRYTQSIKVIDLIYDLTVAWKQYVSH